MRKIDLPLDKFWISVKTVYILLQFSIPYMEAGFFWSHELREPGRMEMDLFHLKIKYMWASPSTKNCIFVQLKAITSFTLK